MKINKLLAALMAAAFSMSAAAQVAISDAGTVKTASWAAQAFRKGAVPPFSFNYDGRSSRDFITTWNYTKSALPAKDKGVKSFRVEYADPAGGLKVECDVNVYSDYNAVDWLLRFKNGGSSDTKQISAVRTADISLASHGGAPRLHYNRGSSAGKDDFAPQLKQFTTTGDRQHMQCVEGRSSSGEFLPFYTIEDPARAGIVVGVGWSGTWATDFEMTSPSVLSMKTGMATFDAYLEPGESVRVASIGLLFYRGADTWAGTNPFRQFMLQHRSRKIDGKVAYYPMFNGFDWGSYPCDEFSCLRASHADSIIAKNKEKGLSAEAYWLDAGWYVTAADRAQGGNWANRVGEWTVDKERFPNGFRDMSKAIHDCGQKFMVWFEPERVIPGTRYDREHPEWMLRTSDHDGQYLFDLSNPAAVDWLSKDIIRIMDENGIDIYRQDFNMAADIYWNAYNSKHPRRAGICEAKYIEGLYTFWSNILRHFPHGLIDNCASGGRRIDYETMALSAPMWRTDYAFGEPVGQQNHTYGLSTYIAQNGTGTLGFNGISEFNVRSFLSSAGVFNWVVMDDKLEVERQQQLMREFRDVRPYFYEDFYQLTPPERLNDENIWLAYELLRPKDRSGYVVAFRRGDCKEADCVVKLHGLDAGKQYTITNYDSHVATTASGSSLMSGYKLHLGQPRTSLLLKIEEK